jgi:hypothetical protein
MRTMPFRRAIVLAVAGVLLSAAAALADTISADGDILNPDVSSFVELGSVAPGGSVTVAVAFELNCVGTRHVNADQSVLLTLGSMTVPTGGSASATPAHFDPPGTGWPADGVGCSGQLPIAGATLSQVTLTAPTTPNNGYLYTLMWTRTLSPVGSDFGTFSGSTAVTFSLDVVTNTPPVLTLPGDQGQEGDMTGGARADYVVSATDAEDNPDPTPVCSPADGTFIPLGTTTVNCSVTDSGGLTVSGSFRITVVDTTRPVLAGTPGNQSVNTTNPAGAAVTYSAPTATDLVDASPVVTCSPASGSVFPVGSTTVVCTARDSSGNVSTSSFTVTVVLRHPPVLNLPGNLVQEGDMTGGAHASYTVSATDVEDNPDPTPACSPAVGAFIQLGTTTINCSVTDADGQSDSGSFKITVVDTTRPVLAGMPGNQSRTTSDPTGAAVSWTSPTASDVVDASPAVSCNPASGSVFPVGVTTVTCRATDDSGNVATAAFTVTVALRTDSWSVAWGEPVSGNPASLTANGGRSIPIKARVTRNGIDVTTGDGILRVTACDATTPTAEMGLTWSGRWTGKVDTSTLAGGCYHVAIVIDGVEAGWFRLDIEGAAPAKTPNKSPSTTTKH